MRYTGTFKDVNNREYAVEIITNYSATDIINLEFAASPFITEYESENIVFKPVKYSSATIGLITQNIYYDLYSSVAQGSKVMLIDKKDNRILWTGYLTPNIYNLNFNYSVEELELEAIDGLSTLQYIDYKSETRGFKKIKDILVNIVRSCNCYRFMFLPNSIQESNGKNEVIYNNLYISEANFFDEDDKPMKCDEVLEEICKYLGLTAIAQGDTVYFLDYESFTKGFSEGFICNMEGILSGGLASLRDIRRVNKNFYTANKTQVSLGDTFNKIKVVDSLYSVDSVFPKLEDKALLKNKNKDDFYELIKVVYPIDANLTYNAFMKFYEHPNFKSYYYYKDAQGNIIPNNNPYVNNYYNLGDNIGGTIIKAFVKKQEEEGDVNKIPSLDWQTYIYIQNLGWQDGQVRKLISTKMNKEIGLNKDTYIILEGSINFSSRDRYIPITDYEFGGDGFKKENLYIEGILRYGTKYYNGTNWQNTECPFKIYLDCDDNETGHLYNKSWDIKSNINFTMNLETTSGLSIKLPDNYFTTEVPEFTFIQPRHLITNKNNPEKLPYTGYWVSGFDMKLEVANFNSDDKEEEDTDTSYENVINENFVNDFEEEEFKICTWDNKAPNYSAVVYNGPEGTKYLDKLFNIGTRDYGRAEELFINRIIRQYSNPPLIIDVLTFNNINCGTIIEYPLFGSMKRFVVDKQSIDWKYNTNMIRLIEIKL